MVQHEVITFLCISILYYFSWTVKDCSFGIVFQVFKLDRMKPNLTPLSLPENIQIRETLERVLRLPSVASKRYLTNKVNVCWYMNRSAYTSHKWFPQVLEILEKPNTRLSKVTEIQCFSQKVIESHWKSHIYSFTYRLVCLIFIGVRGNCVQMLLFCV